MDVEYTMSSSMARAEDDAVAMGAGQAIIAGLYDKKDETSVEEVLPREQVQARDRLYIVSLLLSSSPSPRRSAV